MNDVPALLAATARLPLVVRRRTLRGRWLIDNRIRRGPDLGLAPVLRQTLRLGDHEAARIGQEVAFQDALCLLEWAALLARTTGQLISDAQRVEVDGADVLERAAATGKPIILAPLHMGNYVFGIAVAMRTFFSGRPMLILRAREDNAGDTRVMQRISEIGTEMRFLQVSDKASYVDAVRFVRQGAVVVYFVDLPPSYGGPVDVTLFGRRAQLAMGIDSLARVAGATVIPLSVHSTLAGDRLTVGRPFEVVDTGQTEKARVAGLVARHVEAAILRDPAQWHFWPRLSEFAPRPETLDPLREAAA